MRNCIFLLRAKELSVSVVSCQLHARERLLSFAEELKTAGYHDVKGLLRCWPIESANLPFHRHRQTLFQIEKYPTGIQSSH
jgi:hypothetical protein